ncbi:MAG TPA: hypothetical protein VJW77_03730 [Terriglobia bacterium]|nr:hypothetical protein [Terriglobia bacterium]
MDVKKYLELKRRTEHQISDFMEELYKTYNGNYKEMLEAANYLLDEAMKGYEEAEKQNEGKQWER